MKVEDYNTNLSVLFLSQSFTAWDSLFQIPFLFRRKEEVDNIRHAYMVITNPSGSSYIITADGSFRVYLMKFDKFVRLMKQANIEVPTCMVDVGSHNISVVNVMKFVDRKVFRFSSIPECLFWWLISRHIFKTHKPFTCSILCSYMLRLSGVHVPDCVYPRDLYKELINATDYNCWTGKSWEDYVSRLDRKTCV